MSAAEFRDLLIRRFLFFYAGLKEDLIRLRSQMGRLQQQNQRMQLENDQLECRLNRLVERGQMWFLRTLVISTLNVPLRVIFKKPKICRTRIGINLARAGTKHERDETSHS